MLRTHEAVISPVHLRLLRHAAVTAVVIIHEVCCHHAVAEKQLSKLR